jgi:hypothetical protein
MSAHSAERIKNVRGSDVPVGVNRHVAIISLLLSGCYDQNSASFGRKLHRQMRRADAVEQGALRREGKNEGKENSHGGTVVTDHDVLGRRADTAPPMFGTFGNS